MPMHACTHNCAHTLMTSIFSCHNGHSQSQCELLCAAKACNSCVLAALLMGHLYRSALACEAFGAFGREELKCAGLCTAGWGRFMLLGGSSVEPTLSSTQHQSPCMVPASRSR